MINKYIKKQEKIMTTFLAKILTWFENRFKERTSWDGVIIILGALAVILFGGVIKLLAWFALAYGVWTLFLKENGS